MEWYHSLGQLIDGLMKNSYSAVEYNPVLMVLGAAGYLVVGLGPLAGLVLGDGMVRDLGAAAVGFQLLLFGRGAREAGVPLQAVLLYPVALVMLGWIVVRALALNHWQGGITWRGTFYPLSELRKNRL